MREFKGAKLRLISTEARTSWVTVAPGLEERAELGLILTEAPGPSGLGPRHLRGFNGGQAQAHFDWGTRSRVTEAPALEKGSEQIKSLA